MVTIKRIVTENWQGVHIRGIASSKAKRGQEHRVDEMYLAYIEEFVVYAEGQVTILMQFSHTSLPLPL